MMREKKSLELYWIEFDIFSSKEKPLFSDFTGIHPNEYI
jgi:hypothetical protein